eukprot:Opistho-2@93341
MLRLARRSMTDVTGVCLFSLAVAMGLRLPPTRYSLDRVSLRQRVSSLATLSHRQILTRTHIRTFSLAFPRTSGTGGGAVVCVRSQPQANINLRIVPKNTTIFTTDTFSYQLIIGNAGPSTVNNLRITANVPVLNTQVTAPVVTLNGLAVGYTTPTPLLWSFVIPTLANNTNAILLVNYGSFNTSVQYPSTVTFSATSTMPDGIVDPFPESDVTETAVSIVSVADLFIAGNVTINGTTNTVKIRQGDPLTMNNITVGNRGPSAAFGLTVTLTFPAGMYLDTIAPSDLCSGRGPVVCAVGRLPAGSNFTLSNLKFATPGLTTSDAVTVRAVSSSVGEATAKSNLIDVAAVGTKLQVNSVKIESSNGDATLFVGASVRVIAQVTNLGPRDGVNTIVSLEVPSTFEKIQADLQPSTLPSTYSEGSRFVGSAYNVSYTATTLPFQTQIVATTVFRVLSNATAGAFTVRCVADARDRTGTTDDYVKSAPATLQRKSDLTFTLSDLPRVKPVVGDIFNATATAVNVGPSDMLAAATNTVTLVIGDVGSPLIANAFVSRSPDCAAPSITNGVATITCTARGLVVRGSVTYYVAFKLPATDSVTVKSLDSSGAERKNYTIAVERRVNLQLFIQAQSEEVRTQQPTLYSFIVRNGGRNNATGIVITHTLSQNTRVPPANHFSVQSATFNNGTADVPCNITNPLRLVCNIPSSLMSAGSPQLRGRVRLTGINAGVATIAVAVESNEVDMDTSDNTGNINLFVKETSDLVLDSKFDPLFPYQGGKLLLTHRIFTLGPSNASNVVLTLTVPNYAVALDPADVTKNNCSSTVAVDGSRTFVCGMASIIHVDESITAQFSFNVNASFSGASFPYYSRVSQSPLEEGNTESSVSNNIRSLDIAVYEPYADLAVQAGQAPTITNVAGSLVYINLTITNKGPLAVPSVLLSHLPYPLSFTPQSVIISVSDNNTFVPIANCSGRATACPLPGMNLTTVITFIVSGIYTPPAQTITKLEFVFEVTSPVRDLTDSNSRISVVAPVVAPLASVAVESSSSGVAGWIIAVAVVGAVASIGAVVFALHHFKFFSRKLPPLMEYDGANPVGSTSVEPPPLED